VLAVVGHTARDLVDTFAPRPGGVPFHAARGLRALGETALLVTRCAEEDRALLGPLYALGLPVAWRPEAQTAVFRIRNRPGGRELEIGALGEPWSVETVGGWLKETLAGAGWVHAGPLWRGDFPAETLALLAAGRRLSFDGQGLVRPARTGPVEMDADVDLSILRDVDVLHLSEREARVLGLELDARSLGSLGVPEVIVTLGDHGSFVYAHGRTHAVPARAVDSADPTGAGDAFIAAYAASRLSGHAPLSAARRATQLVEGLLSRALAPW
jgi:sugar/nucleoside kinase (ribokinase family)